MEPSEDQAEPCGSWRVVEYDHGYQAVVRWCERTAGPCPWPNTEVGSKGHGSEQRECAVGTQR